MRSAIEPPPARPDPAPGHTDGHQVVVETSEGAVVFGGDVGTSFLELGSATTEGQRRVLALGAPTGSHARRGRRSRNITPGPRAQTRVGKPFGCRGRDSNPHAPSGDTRF